MRETAKIVGFSVLAAVAYGIAHDLVTAHVCVEYFTIAHPPVFQTPSPFWLALGWGIIATWWMGMVLGILLAGAARVGHRPKVTLMDVKGAISRLMLVSGVLALGAGLLGASLAHIGAIYVSGGWETSIPPERHERFLFAAWAHSASYLVAAVGGLFVIAQTWRRRGLRAQPAP